MRLVAIAEDVDGPGRSWPGRSASLADLALFGIVVFSNVDFGTLGLSSDSGADLGKWVVLFPFWLAPGCILLLSRSLPDRLRQPPLCWLSLWAGWTLVTALWTLDLQQTVLIGLPTIVIVCFVVWYVSLYGWIRFLRIFSAGALVFMWASFIAEIVVGSQPGAGGRLTGLSFGPTDIGTVGALSLVVAGALWASGTATVLARACAASAAVTLVWADARGSMIAAAVGLVIVLVKKLGSWRAFVASLAAAAVVVAMFVVSGAGTADLTRSGDPHELTSLTGRTDVWPIAIHLIGERPWLGHGTGSSEALFNEAASEGLIWWRPYNAHDVILTVALEQGVLGAVVFATALLSAGWRLRRTPWALALLAAFVVNGLTEAMVERPTTALAALAAAMAVAAGPPDAPEQEPLTIRRARHRSTTGARHRTPLPSRTVAWSDS